MDQDFNLLIEKLARNLDSDTRSLVADVTNLKILVATMKVSIDTEVTLIKHEIDILNKIVVRGNGRESIQSIISRLDERVKELENIENAASELIKKSSQNQSQPSGQKSDPNLSITRIISRKEIAIAIVGLVGTLLTLLIPLWMGNKMNNNSEKINDNNSKIDNSIERITPQIDNVP